MQKKIYKKQERYYFSLCNGQINPFNNGSISPLAKIIIHPLINILEQLAFNYIEFLYSDSKVFIKRVNSLYYMIAIYEN